MRDDALRLRKLIEHWIEHNEGHGVRFEEAVKEALDNGLDMVAERLMNVLEKAAVVSELLKRAKEAFK
jgi:hypothetical protein